MIVSIFDNWNKLPPVVMRIFSGFLIFITFWLASFIISRFVKRISAGKHITIIKFIDKLIRNILLIIGLICALGTAGINVTAIVASLGLASFAAGYALKDMLSNFIAGFMIILNGTVKPGDHIAIASFEGIVEYTSLRYTVLISENKQYYIPNGTFTTSPLTIFAKGTN
jgi:small-conductance mechanosensitive channel